jgi:hypothetical protein
MKSRYFSIVFAKIFSLQICIGHRSTQKIYRNIQIFLSKCNRGLSIIKGLAICARISEVNVIF